MPKHTSGMWTARRQRLHLPCEKRVRRGVVAEDAGHLLDGEREERRVRHGLASLPGARPAVRASTPARMPTMTTLPVQEAEITLRVNGEEHRLTRRHPHHAARRAARAPRPDRRQEGLRPRPVRRLHGAARRPPRQRLPAARRRRTTAPRSPRRGPGRRRRRCTRCSRRSSTTTPSSAATARRARSARRSGCSTSSSAGWPSARHRRPRRGDPVLDDDEIRERMSGNLCRCGAYANIVAGRSAEAAPMRPFAYERAADAAAAVAAVADTRTPHVPRRRHQPRRPDEARRRDARAARRRLAPAARRASRSCRTAALRDRRRRPQQRPRRRPRSCASATRCSPRRCWPAPRGSCATWPRSAATCCSAPAAPTSRTSPSRATSARPGSGCPAREGDHRNLAVLGHSAHCVATHPSDMAVALAALDAACTSPARTASARSRCPACTGCPATSPQRDTVLEPGELITAVDLPAAAGRRALALPQGPRPRVVRLRPRLGRGRARRRRRRGRATCGSPSAALAHAPWRADARRGGAARRARPPRRASRPPPTPSSTRRGRCATTPSRSRWRATCSSRTLTELGEEALMADRRIARGASARR